MVTVYDCASLEQEFIVVHCLHLLIVAPLAPETVHSASSLSHTSSTMGNAAPIAIREGNKPLDASDITDLEQAKLEITRMRTTIHRLAPRKLPDLMDYGREWLAKYGGGYENESFLYETLDTIKQMQPAIEQIFTKHADDHPGQESDMSYEEFLLSLADLQAFTDAGTKFTAASEQEKQQMFNNLDADFNRVLNKAEPVG